MADAGPLAAALEEIGERNERRITALAYTEATVATVAEGDVRLLLKAAAAALEVHALTAFHRHTEPCDRHRYRGIADRSRCPDCKVIEWTGCEACRDEYGSPAKAEDCTTRQAITRALLGEEAPDGA